MRNILISTSSFSVPGNKALAKLATAGFSIVLNPYGRRLTEHEAKELLAAPGLVGLIAGVEPLTRQVLAGAQALQVISRCGIGLDSVDLVAANEFGMLVSNTPEAPAMAVAELTLGLMLDMMRRIAHADRNIRAHAWKQLMGNLLAAQTVGIVGYGGIGQRVARLVKVFGARVLVCDNRPVEAEVGIELCDFKVLLAESDIVSLHLPYTPKNHHLLNAATLGQMKHGAMLINAARGGLVDEAALCVALKEGRLAGAALDCFENEPYDGELTQLDQVVLTAHMGSYAQESRLLMEREAADNLLQGLKAKGLIK